MLHSYMDEFKEEELKKDYIERLRILETTIQQTTNQLNLAIKEKETPLAHCVKLQINVKECVDKLNEAVLNSHKIAIKDYSNT